MKMPDRILHLTLENAEIVIPGVRLLESGPLERLIPVDVNNRVVANLDYDNEYLPVYSFDEKEKLSEIDFRGAGEYVCLEHGKTRFCILCRSSEEINPETGRLHSLPGCMCYSDSVISDVMITGDRLFLQLDVNVIKKLTKQHKQQVQTDE